MKRMKKHRRGITIGLTHKREVEGMRGKGEKEIKVTKGTKKRKDKLRYGDVNFICLRSLNPSMRQNVMFRRWDT
jgi:hypothetical protein